jgi:phosphoribosylaminoimidazole-succinocarboxamide synthase
MPRRRQIFEGKAKILFEGPEPGTLVQYFKDDVSSGGSSNRGVITGKGVLNNRISEYLLTKLSEIGIATHFVRRLNMREQVVREVEMIPIQVFVYNFAAGEFARRFGLAEGASLPRSIVEYYYQSDELGHPMVSEEHITAFGWATPQDMDETVSLALRINDFLVGLFLGMGMRLMNLKMEFGRLWEEDQMRIVLADEICPDSCLLWDIRADQWLNKKTDDEEAAQGADAHQEVARRLGILPESGPSDIKGPDTLQ